MPIFLVDTGNVFHGSLFLPTFRGEQDRYYFNLMNYSSLSLGVEDFFTNNNDLKTFLTGLQLASGRAVSSNLDVSAEPLLAGLVDNWAVVVDQGVKVGIVSVISSVLHLHSNAGPKVNVSEPVAAVRVAVNQLKLQHPDCNIVILLSNSESDTDDLSIAKTVYEIDVVVQGNRLLRSKFDPEHPYPSVVLNEVGNTVLFVSAGDRGAHIGDLQVTFDHAGHVQAWDGDTMQLTNATATDAATWSKVKIDDGVIQTFKNQAVGQTVKDIDQWTDDGQEFGCGWWDCPLGRLIAEAMFQACSDCDIALQNAGGIKANIPAGNVTLGALYAAYPFQNTMVTMNLGGTALVEAFKTAVNRTNGFGSFAHLKGARFAYNPNATNVAEKIALIQVQNRATQQWEDAVATRVYRIAVNNFIAGGGDGYDVLKREGFDVNFYYPDLTTLAANYLSSLAAPLDWPTSASLEEECATSTALTASANGSVWNKPNCSTFRTTARSNWFTQCATSAACVSGLEVLPGLLATDCGACSGLGNCSLRVCQCFVPSQGIFAGLDMIRGADCADVRKQDILDDGWRGFLYFLIAVTIALTVTSSAIYFYYINMAALKRSQPIFIQIILLGVLLACAGMLIDLAPLSVELCWGREILFSLCFTLTMGTLFVRSYRMYRFLVFRQIKDMKVIKTQMMLLLLLVIVLIDIFLVLLRVWLEPTNLAVFLHPSEWQYDVRCFDAGSHPIQVASTVYKALILIFGVFIAFQTRKIPFEDFNDSSAIAFCIYNTTFLSIIGLPINSVLHLDQQLILEVIVYCYLGISTILRLLGPKIRLILIGEGNRALPNNITPSTGSMTSRSFDDAQMRDPQYLQAKIKETEEMLESLKSMLQRTTQIELVTRDNSNNNPPSTAEKP